ncbi:hypothetical protein [Actinoallomurus rhizosphaericola]|uniref:hypothetical protein n=1 Tax=Actinoallomurus rhizosphaericola TaxID=2952536 RepID=UPI0020922802|nr:hypothetical protein [Actinoallomurus rhizosphaericola]MCO5999287.1 hypothetical protein [Actinoallomurus rhizosphaericola]
MEGTSGAAQQVGDGGDARLDRAGAGVAEAEDELTSPRLSWRGSRASRHRPYRHRRTLTRYGRYGSSPTRYGRARRVPGVKRLQRALGGSQARAYEVQAYLAALAEKRAVPEIVR